jgi:hypothetical protein
MKTTSEQIEGDKTKVSGLGKILGTMPSTQEIDEARARLESARASRGRSSLYNPAYNSNISYL